MRSMIARVLPAVLLALALPLAGCKQTQRFFFGGPPPGTPGYVIGFLGAVIADEPRAALEAREVLSEGGNAADAATTMALTLAVTLPSRAGLGGGGACLAYFPPAKTPEAIMFLPQPAESAGTDRPAAVPMLLRGLLTLQARHGTRTIANLIQPAEGLARFGVPVSTALARDLKVVGQALTLDPGAARAFASITGGPLTEGTTLMQPDLGTTFAEIRINGVNDLYGGALAERLERASANAGSPITAADLAKARAGVATPIIIPGWPRDHDGGDEEIAFLPLPADGGLAAAAAFQAFVHNAQDVSGAKAIALAVAARYRHAGGDAKTLLSTPPAAPRACRRSRPRPVSSPSTARGVRSPAMSPWAICSASGGSRAAPGSCSPPRPRRGRRRCSPPRSPSPRRASAFVPRSRRRGRKVPRWPPPPPLPRR